MAPTSTPPRRGLFLLGPDQWDGQPGLEPPDWPEELGSPKDLRLHLAASIEKDASGAICTVVMDPDEQDDDESEADFFHRLELENRIEHYFVFVPPNCKVLGTVFEGGMLQRDFQWGRHPKITLFLHGSVFEQDPETGHVTFTEKGKRTRYLESLAKVADDNVEWSDVEDLEHNVLIRARAVWFGL